MGKKANFHASFLYLTTIENKTTGFFECNKVYVSIYSSFKSFIKCFIVQTTKILSQIIDSIKFCPQIFGSKWENIYPWLPAWQSGSKQILIGGFQKGKTCSCISRDTKVAGCQTFFIFQKLHFYVSYCRMKTAPPMNTYDFFKY